MNDDLVKRLRKTGERIAIPCHDNIKGCLAFHFRIETNPLCAEAANRIEKLEAKLAMMIDRRDALRAVMGACDARWVRDGINVGPLLRRVIERDFEKALGIASLKQDPVIHESEKAAIQAAYDDMGAE